MTSSAGSQRARTLRAHGLGLILAATTAGLLTWGAQRPALWLDESATVVATQRTWPNLWRLLDGADAPLVPYYTLLKLATEALGGLMSSLTARPELLYRLPSVIAMVVAVWVLAVWLARRSLTLALASTATLLLTSSFSRFGQEARPYALVLCAAVVSTVLWSTMATRRRPAWILAYALSVSALVAGHLLAGSLVAAHLVAALIVPTAPKAAPPTSPSAGGTAPPASSGVRRRFTLIGRTALGAVLGIVMVAPFALPASGHGVGPTKDSFATWDHLLAIFVDLFVEGTGSTPPAGISGLGELLNPPDGAPLRPAAAFLVLIVIGLPLAFVGPHRFVARVALAWALTPVLVLLPVMMTRPNLIMARYLVFVVPGWSLLAGLGVVAVARLISWPNGRRERHEHPEAGHRDRLVVVRAVAGGLAAALLLGILIDTQLDSLAAVRTPGAHSEDVRPALALADQPAYATLPIIMTSLFSTLEISAYHRADEPRLLGSRVQRDQTSIWPVSTLPGSTLPGSTLPGSTRTGPTRTGPTRTGAGGSSPTSAGSTGPVSFSNDSVVSVSVATEKNRRASIERASAQRTGRPEMVLLLRAPSPALCRQRFPGAPLEYVRHCMPRWLKEQHYQVLSAQDAGHRWTFAVLTRRAGPAGRS